MRCALTTAAIVGLSLVLASQAQDPQRWQPIPDAQFAALPIYLVPVGDPKKDKLPDAATIWSNLIKDMNSDEQTRTLIKKLMNCSSYAIATPPKNVDGEFRPAAPKGKSQVYLGIAFSDGMKGAEEFEGSMIGTSTYIGFETGPTRAWAKKATPWDAFVIAANEHLFRTKKGYHLTFGTLFDPAHIDFNNPDIRDSSKRGAYIDEEIKGFLKKYDK